MLPNELYINSQILLKVQRLRALQEQQPSPNMVCKTRSISKKKSPSSAVTHNIKKHSKRKLKVSPQSAKENLNGPSCKKLRRALKVT